MCAGLGGALLYYPLVANFVSLIGRGRGGGNHFPPPSSPPPPSLLFLLSNFSIPISHHFLLPIFSLPSCSLDIFLFPVYEPSVTEFRYRVRGRRTKNSKNSNPSPRFTPYRISSIGCKRTIHFSEPRVAFRQNQTVPFGRNGASRLLLRVPVQPRGDVNGH